jgi:hypothetical protein
VRQSTNEAPYKTLIEILPQIIGQGFPEADQQNIIQINRKILEMKDSIRLFCGALALLDFSELQIAQAKAIHNAPNPGPINPQRSIQAHQAYNAATENPSAWIEIAGRDAGITIQDFAASFYAAKSRILGCKVLKNLVIKKELAIIATLLGEYFPHAKDIRHGVAHPSDISNTPARNAFSGSYHADGLSIGNSIDTLIKGTGRVLVVTIDHQIFRCVIDQEALRKLIDIQQKFCAIVESLEKLSKQKYRELSQISKNSLSKNK